MHELFAQLGINWPMLAAQAVNFAILLIVLTVFVYRPLMKAMEERRKKIELGIKGALIAEQKIAEAEQEKTVILKDADKEAATIIGIAEKKAVDKSAEITSIAEKKSEKIISEAMVTIEKKKAEEISKLNEEAAKLVKAAIVKAVEISPSQIDDKLISQAIEAVKK